MASPGYPKLSGATLEKVEIKDKCPDVWILRINDYIPRAGESRDARRIQSSIESYREHTVLFMETPSKAGTPYGQNTQQEEFSRDVVDTLHAYMSDSISFIYYKEKYYIGKRLASIPGEKPDIGDFRNILSIKEVPPAFNTILTSDHEDITSNFPYKYGATKGMKMNARFLNIMVSPASDQDIKMIQELERKVEFKGSSSPRYAIAQPTQWSGVPVQQTSYETYALPVYAGSPRQPYPGAGVGVTQFVASGSPQAQFGGFGTPLSGSPVGMGRLPQV